MIRLPYCLLFSFAFLLLWTSFAAGTTTPHLHIVYKYQELDNYVETTIGPPGGGAVLQNIVAVQFSEGSFRTDTFVKLKRFNASTTIALEMENLPSAHVDPIMVFEIHPQCMSDLSRKTSFCRAQVLALLDGKMPWDETAEELVAYDILLEDKEFTDQAIMLSLPS
jgi:hypothetical protein